MHRLSHGRSAEVLSVQELEVRYQGRAALHDVTFTLHRGDMVALIGPNGAGKTTLMRAVAALLPHGGTVRISGGPARLDGRTADGVTAGVAYVPQRLGFPPSFPVTAGRLVMGGRRRRLGPWRPVLDHDRVAVERALSRVGLPHVARRPISELSGGQLQRVVLARALAQDARLLLLDEPLSGVDTPSREHLLGLLGTLCDQGCTVLLSTHDLGLVRTRFARCIGINRTVRVDGTPDLALAPDTLDEVFRTPEVAA